MQSITSIHQDKPPPLRILTDMDRLTISRVQLATKQRLGIPISLAEFARLTGLQLRTAMGGPQ